jgi:hypothetical protein
LPVLELDNGAVIVALPDRLRTRGVQLAYLSAGRAISELPGRLSVLQADMLAALDRREREGAEQESALRSFGGLSGG